MSNRLSCSTGQILETPSAFQHGSEIPHKCKTATVQNYNLYMSKQLNLSPQEHGHEGASEGRAPLMLWMLPLPLLGSDMFAEGVSEGNLKRELFTRRDCRRRCEALSVCCCLERQREALLTSRYTCR